MSIRRFAAFGGTAFRDFMWPRRCSGCGFRGVWLCDECAERHPVWQPPWCARCGVPEEFSCHCHELSGAIAAARAAGRHIDWLQRGVQLFKFRDEMTRAELFGPMIARAIADLPAPDLIVAVPLHPKRVQERGYNQAELLAERLSSDIGVPFLEEGVFVRSLNTPHQTGRSGIERRRNLAGAFEVRNSTAVAGRSVLLIDDVVTSGATVSTCASVLRGAGAARVTVASVSRAINVRVSANS